MLKVDNSTLSCFHQCPRKYQKRYVKHLVKEDGNTTAMDFGSALHTGLETWYKTGSKIGMLMDFENAYHMLQIFDKKRTLENGKKILEEYAHLHPTEDFKVLAVEESRSRVLTLDTFEVEFCGRIDLRGQEFDGTEFVMDHKSSSSMMFTPKPNHQMTGYLWLTGAAKAVVNLLGVYAPGTRKTREERFLRVETKREPCDYDGWKQWVAYECQKIQDCIDRDEWPMSGDCVFCAYQTLCNADPSNQKMLENNMYKVSEWIPGKGIKVEGGGEK